MVREQKMVVDVLRDIARIALDDSDPEVLYLAWLSEIVRARQFREECIALGVTEGRGLSERLRAAWMQKHHPDWWVAQEGEDE